MWSFRQPRGREPEWRLPGFHDRAPGEERPRCKPLTQAFTARFLQRSMAMHGKASTHPHELSVHIRCLLQDRDSFLNNNQLNALSQAYIHGPKKRRRKYGTRSTKARVDTTRRQGVYIWVHNSPDHKKVYIGSYHSTCLFTRTKHTLPQPMALLVGHRCPGSSGPSVVSLASCTATC